MAVSDVKRELFKKKSQPYKQKIDELKKSIAVAKRQMKSNKRLRHYIVIENAQFTIAYVNSLILISKLSEKIQGARNNTYLNDARKELSNCLNELNKVFGEQMNASLTENQKLFEKMQDWKVASKLRLLTELKDTIETVKRELGENSKWRWSFSDMFFRYLAFSKNIFDFKYYQKIKDPNYEDYRVMQEYIEYLKETSEIVVHEFRAKYELTAGDLDDLYKIRYVIEMQKQLYSMDANQEKLKFTQTALDNIENKISAAISKKEEAY